MDERYGSGAEWARPAPPPISDLPVDEGFGYFDPERRITITTRAILGFEEDLARLQAWGPDDPGDLLSRSMMIAAVEGQLESLRAELADLKAQTLPEEEDEAP